MRIAKKPNTTAKKPNTTATVPRASTPVPTAPPPVFLQKQNSTSAELPERVARPKQSIFSFF
jgi:hypothetical protein